MARPHQAHGLRSKVYTPVLLAIFKARYKKGAKRIAFTLEDVRDELLRQGVQARNTPDLIYRMKSRTALPAEIQEAGYMILEITSRGKYAFVQGADTLVQYPEGGKVSVIDDRTPEAIKELLPGDFGKIDEQGLLSVLRYNDLFSRFLGVPVFHFKSHVRKSVPGVGQVEIDDVHIAVDVGSTKTRTVVPVEAKAKDDPVNRTQIAMQIRYAQHAFPTLAVRPLTVKLFESGVMLFMEFNVTTDPNKLTIVAHQSFRFR